jgi:hypothetical protein
VRENEGVAARILLDFDADAKKIRDEIIRLLTGAVPGHQPLERHLDLLGVSEWRPLHDRAPLMLSIVLGVFAFPAGLLVGWLIWG